MCVFVEGVYEWEEVCVASPTPTNQAEYQAYTHTHTHARVSIVTILFCA